MKVLVTGGVRSGKSRLAQQLLVDAGAPVTYVAAGPKSDDADWQRRIAAHRASRPSSWTTVEPSSRDVPQVLREARTSVIVECLGTWLTALLDDVGAWGDTPGWRDDLGDQLDAFTAAVRQCPQPLVLVSNEVGWGLVSEHRSGRIFADELGRLNQRVAADCDQVILAVSGLPVVVK